MILMGLCNESGGLCPVNNISAELCMSVRLGLPITFCGFAMAAKEKLIINRDVSGGYCKTAVSRWPFSQTKIK